MKVSIKTLTLIIIMVLTLFLSIYASSESDIPEERIKAAKRYMKVAPMGKMMNDAINEIAMRVAVEKRDEFVRYMKKIIRTEFLEKLALESMLETFTAEELNALADFYGSEVGRSVMSKFGKYMGEVMPAIQQEIMRALQEAMKENELKEN